MEENNKPEEEQEVQQEVAVDNVEETPEVVENKEETGDNADQAPKDEIENPEEPLGSGDEIQVLEEDEEGQDEEPNKPKKKRRRQVKRVKKKAGFNLDGMHHIPEPKYNALKDSHLQSYFVNDRVRKHLQKMNLITREGYIIEKPDEYRRNKMLLKAHFRSSSPNREENPRKTRKANNEPELVDKENHENFIEDIKNQYKMDE